ncbi:MAG: Fe-S cluster assembly protein SufD [Bacteroidetes bacterium]|nr:Fe-S cluster assembly protein SufD [Bacteroidota bacterium]
MKTIEASGTAEKYIELFTQNRGLISNGEPVFISELREEAIRSFEKNGFPDRAQEDYRYSHLEPAFDGELSFVFTPREISFDNRDLFRCDVPMLDANVLTVLNGFFYNPDGPALFELGNGIIYGSLKEAINTYPDLVREHLGKNANMEKEAFVSLNTAFSQDGIFLYVPKGKKLEKPIQIINLLLSDKNQMVQHRNLFVVEENGSAQVIICDHTLSPHLFLTNSVTESFVGENADLDVLRLQNEHNNSCQVTNTWISQKRSSRCQHGTITLHGGRVRNNLHVKMSGEGAETNAMGLFLEDKMQHVDNFTVIEHAAPNCSSNQHYKGVLDDMSTGAFNGKIHVYPDAQKTQAFQSNNNILLTNTARMHTKPQLEIYADDVKCSHGATVGQLDEDALFYLQSRGIPINESRLLLMDAFTHEVISRIKQSSLQERISDLVSKRLRGELSRCNNCAMNCQD